ncbi:hypothetical protein SCB71_21300 (plasmid) [Herbiconiux sp. KACC 21604]|uniref:hypothetical protein n=1 Tax=unclassified Herbiconiux TaxID=2618217 RepID=UPI0014918871|nr:hypothetical protein [Herbiconiux sp. SALV-R1]QJU56283.1 hypothetical protein HL652_21100 [Herbiconiux sp. SALV-R1]WPO88787.1 hypothetical protein SCB71_21300 [Herbiconiux sp. KACC 21604]
MVEQLCFNSALSAKQIDDITARHPSLREIFAANPSASARHKGERKVTELSDANLYLFFQEVKATEPEIRALQAIRRDAIANRRVKEAPLLWDVWMSVHEEKSAE